MSEGDAGCSEDVTVPAEDGEETPNVKYVSMADLLEDQSEDEIWLTMQRVRKIEGVSREKLREIHVTACLLEEMSGIEGCGNLEELDLSQNVIGRIESLAGMRRLKSLDLSFNRIRVLEGLEDCAESLEVLRVQNNKIKSIPSSLESFKLLRELELGSNKIATVEHVPVGNLEQLWLGRNRIRELKAEFSGPLPKLKILSYQNNRLRSFRGEEGEATEFFRNFPNLTELYLSENFIDEPPVVELLQLTHLETLDLSSNQIESVGVLPEMTQLKELWLSNNKIEDLEEIRKLKTLVNLETLYLEHNPFKQNLGPAYKQAILDILPNLKQLDAIYLTVEFTLKR